jgi:hypothetical protein
MLGVKTRTPQDYSQVKNRPYTRGRDGSRGGGRVGTTVGVPGSGIAYCIEPREKGELPGTIQEKGICFTHPQHSN